MSNELIKNATTVNADIVARLERIIDNDLTKKEKRLGDSDLANLVFDKLTVGWSHAKRVEVSWEVKHVIRDILRKRREDLLNKHRVGSKWLA